MNTNTFNTQNNIGRRNEAFVKAAIDSIKSDGLDSAFEHSVIAPGVVVITASETWGDIKARLSLTGELSEILAAMFAVSKAAESVADAPHGYNSESRWESSPNSKFSAWDFKSKKTGKTVEAKFDEMAVKTGNFYVESQQRVEQRGTGQFGDWKASGIHASESDYWTVSLPGGIVLMFHTEDVRAAVNARLGVERTCQNYADGFRGETKGRCVPVGVLIQFVSERHSFVL